jgi:hypothetical protein
MANRSTRVAYLQRIQDTHFLLLQGASTSQIIALFQKEHNLKVRQTKRYIAEAKKLFHVSPETILTQQEIALAQAQFIKKEAMQKGELTVALRCLMVEMNLREEFKTHYAKSDNINSQPTLPDTVADALLQPEA